MEIHCNPPKPPLNMHNSTRNAYISFILTFTMKHLTPAGAVAPESC